MVLRKRIRIDVDDGDGVHYDIKMEGDVSKDKLNKIYELMDMLESRAEETMPESVGAKIWHVVEKYFEYTNFTSNMMLEKYEDEYNEPIKLSVISTYLARYSSRMRLRRLKTGREWTYAVAGKQVMKNSR